MAKTAAALVAEFTDFDQQVASHYRVCLDQEEKYGCDECRDLNHERFQARKAMDADPTAKALYDSPAQVESRRLWSRDYVAMCDEYAYQEDY